MKPSDIARLRLQNQLLASPRAGSPAEVVRHLGAVQAQDCPASLWAIGLRMPGATQVDIERAIAEQTLVRTWPMRRTLHFVPAEDARWMLALLAPRAIQRYRRLRGDEEAYERSRALLVGALAGGRRLTRRAALALLEGAGVLTTEQRGYHVISQLAQEGVICFGTA